MPFPPDEGVTIPIQRTPSPEPAPSSRPAPTGSHYAAELPLAEELQELLGSSYVVESFLGQGGMGAVYKGLQMPLRRPVAIKILAKRDAAGGDEDAFEFEERFRREAYAMAALAHPNIVQVYDCGDAGEHYLYISMELVEGGDLSDAIKGGQMTPERALKLIPQICDGLQAAHDRGIVHRDVKPANIFLTADGRAKVADFGLAKKFDAQSTFATKTGMAMGTPDYAAPEQYEAVKDIDHRADVYSLGVMMYQMLTGTLPRGSFRPASQRVGTDPRLDAVLVKAMEHERADRYQSVAEIKADVLAITAGPAPAPKPVVTRAVPAASPASAPVTRAQPQAAGPRSAVAQPAPRQASAAVAAPVPPPKKKSAVPWVLLVVIVAALGGGAMWFTGKRGGNPAAATAGGSAKTPQFTPSSEAWFDRMEGAAITSLKSITREADGWHFSVLKNIRFDSVMTDGALRVLFTPGNDGTDPWIAVRSDADSNGAASAYRFHCYSKQATLYLVRDKNVSPIGPSVKGKFPEPSLFTAGKPVELELRAVGTHLTAKINGETVTSVNDTSVSSGYYRLQFGAGTILHGVQTLDLSKGAAAPAPLAAKGDGTELLPLVDVARGAVAGTWKRSAQGVELATPTGFGILELPYEPPAEYDLEAEFTPTSGGNNVNFHVVAGGSTVIWKVNAHGRNPPIHGLDQLDGKLMTGRTEGVVQKAPALQQGQRYSTRVEVRRDGIRTLINGEEMLDWTGDFKRLGTEETGRLRNPRALGIGSYKRGVIFHFVRVKPISGAAAATAPGLARPAGASATKDAPFVNSLGMKFVPVPGTEILMCIHETRRRDYAAYAGAVPGVDETWKAPVVEKKTLKQTDDDPVVQVNWDDAHAFCEWLSKKEGRAYRLPTEREWNLAVAFGVDDPSGITDDALRKVVGGQFPWGTTYNEADAVKSGNFESKEDAFVGTAPVMSFQPNGLGIYDLGGNAWEWEENVFKPGDNLRALRGCGYRNYGGYRKSGLREPTPHDMRAAPDGDFGRRVPGFRVVVRADTVAPKAPASAAGMPPPLGNGASAAATKEAPFVNSLIMKFVPVPITGGPTNGKRVLFSVWETRVQDYAEFAKEMKDKAGGKVDFAQGPAHPVVNVSWEEVNAYCAWLTARERTAGKIGPKERYRLPSDHEWSCALGIGDKEDATRSPSDRNDVPSAMYLWGSAWPPPSGTGNFGGVELPLARYSNYTKEVLSGYRDDFTETAPVGSFAANASGVHDLAGNAFEWCADEFRPGSGAHVSRGGSWASATRFYLAINRRLEAAANYRDVTRGFRCVLDEE